MKIAKPSGIILIIFVSTLLLMINSGGCLAGSALEPQAEAQAEAADPGPISAEWAIGMQFTRPCDGVSVSIPINEEYLLQPIFYIDINDRFTHRLDYGLRGLYKLAPQSDLNPYLGIGLGHNEHRSSANDTKVNGDGYEIFFGVAYNKYLFQPSFELALGSYKHGDRYQAGLTLNFGLQYCFQP